jgi:pimeloyl-ACP methyl ester carboxylesterase
MSSPATLTRQDGATIAYQGLAGSGPGVVFLGGFRSDMTGTKALHIEDYCRRRGQAYLRFDYFGHGASSGAAALGTIGRWSDDAIAVLDSLTEGPQVLVGVEHGRVDHAARSARQAVSGSRACRYRGGAGLHRRPRLASP